MEIREIEELLKKAFEAGENWGITYSGWFIPTEEDTQKRKEETIAKILSDRASIAIILSDRAGKGTSEPLTISREEKNESK